MAAAAEVKLGADTAELKGKFDDAAKNAEINLRRIQNALGSTATASKTAANDVSAGLNTMNQGFVQATQHAQQHQKQATATAGAMSSVATAAIRAGAAIVGAWLGGKALASVFALEDAVEKLERVMGLTSAEATNMAIALKLAGTNADAFTGTALHIGRVIKNDSDEFRRLGVAIKDTNGNLLPMGEIMRNIQKRMEDFKAGTDQNLFTLALTGRAAKDFANEMENLARVQERAAQIAKAYGLEMGPETQGKIKAFKTELAALGEIFTIAATKVAIELMPAVKDFADWLIDKGPSAVTAFINYIELLRVKFEVMSAEVKAFAVNAGTWFDNMVVRAQKSALTISMTINGQIDEVPAMWAAANDRIIGNNKRGADAVVKIWDDAVANIDKILAKPKTGGGAASGVKSGSETFTTKPTRGRAEADERLAIWKDELVAEKEATGYFNELSKTQEADFWRAKLALTTEGAKADEKIRREVKRLIFENDKAAAREALADEVAALDAERSAIEFDYAERIRLAQQAADKVAAAWGAGSKQASARQIVVEAEKRRAQAVDDQIANIAMRRAESVADHAVDMEQQSVGQRAALQEVSAQQALAADARFEDARFRIAYEGLQRRLVLERDPAKVAAINEQIEKLEQSHETKMTEIANKAVQERKAAALAANDAIRASGSDLLSNLVTTPKKWKEHFMEAAKSIQATLTKLASDKIIKDLFGAGTTGGAWLSKLTGAVGGADTALTAAGTQLSAAAAALQSAAAALSTGAATTSASSGGGFFGSIMDMFSGGGGEGIADIGAGGGGGLAYYAAGTPYVPRNQLAFLHKGERVTPAAQNRGGMGAPVSVQNTFQFAGPVDTRTQSQIAMAASRSVEMATRRHR